MKSTSLCLEELVFGYLRPGLIAHHVPSSQRAETGSCPSLDTTPLLTISPVNFLPDELSQGQCLSVTTISTERSLYLFKHVYKSSLLSSPFQLCLVSTGVMDFPFYRRGN